MIEIKAISQEKIKEIVDTLTEVHTRISALEGIINNFQSAMVGAESQEDRENLLQSVNLLELETSTLKAIASAVERISKICINLHEDNIEDHKSFSKAIESINKEIEPLRKAKNGYIGIKSIIALCVTIAGMIAVIIKFANWVPAS